MMGLQEAWHIFCQQVSGTGSMQWLILVLGVAEVLLAKSNNPWLYPAGIAGTSLSLYMLFRAGLYAECLLNGYYIVMSVYGWWYWANGKNKAPVKVSSCSRCQLMTIALFTLPGFLVLGILLKQFTPSSVPWWDAWVSATAWAGMYLLARRKIENWIWLNLSNAFAIPLLLHKQLPLYALLTAVLFVVAILGYFQWKKLLREDDITLSVLTN
jgi:nicotinamide mononucleotide transporter